MFYFHLSTFPFVFSHPFLFWGRTERERFARAGPRVPPLWISFQQKTKLSQYCHANPPEFFFAKTTLRRDGDMSDKKEQRCSFCRKGKEDTKKLIAGPDEVFICNECVDLCNDILSDELEAIPAPETPEPRTPESEKREILEIKKIDSVTFHNPEDWTYWDSNGRKHPGSVSELGTYCANRRTRISIKERDGTTCETEVFENSRLTTYDDVAHIHFWIPKEE